MCKNNNIAHALFIPYDLLPLYPATHYLSLDALKYVICNVCYRNQVSMVPHLTLLSR